MVFRNDTPACETRVTCPSVGIWAPSSGTDGAPGTCADATQKRRPVTSLPRDLLVVRSCQHALVRPAQPLLCHSATSGVIPIKQLGNSLSLVCLRAEEHRAGLGARTAHLKYSRMSPKGNLCPKIVAQFPWLGPRPRQTHSPALHDFLLCLRDRQPPASGLKAHLHGRGFRLLHLCVCRRTCLHPNLYLELLWGSDLNVQPTDQQQRLLRW